VIKLCKGDLTTAAGYLSTMTVATPHYPHLAFRFALLRQSTDRWSRPPVPWAHRTVAQGVAGLTEFLFNPLVGRPATLLLAGATA
jgi:hypothetical protein